MEIKEEKIRSLKCDRVKLQKKMSGLKGKFTQSLQFMEHFEDEMQSERDEIDMRKRAIEIKEKEIEYLHVMLNGPSFLLKQVTWQISKWEMHYCKMPTSPLFWATLSMVMEQQNTTGTTRIFKLQLLLAKVCL